MKIGDVIKAGIYKKDQEKQLRFECKITPNEFKTTFLETFNFDFVVDEKNKEVINQLYHYLVKSDNFKGDFEKGIVLIGSIGCGKTAIMDAFVEVVKQHGRKVIEKIQSIDIVKIAIENNDYYNKRPLYIDDLGKEAMEVQHYGTVIRPLEDLLDTRYRKNAITFATANYTLEDLQYNKHTKDRLKEMFSFIILPGKSRRK